MPSRFWKTGGDAFLLSRGFFDLLAGLATPTLTNSSALGATPLVLQWSDTDDVVGCYGQLQIASDSGFSTITQNLVFFIDGSSWANLDETIGLISPSGPYWARIRACRDNDSGVTTVTGTDPQGNAVSFTADVSAWSPTFSDTITVVTTVWTTTVGANLSQYLTISGAPALNVAGPGGGFSGAPCWVRATKSQTGKIHWELKRTAVGGHFYVGVDDGTTVLGPGAHFPAPVSPGIIYRGDGGSGTGVIYVNGTLSQTPPESITANDVISVEFDTVSQTVKFFLNGTQLGTTVTGVTLTSWYPVMGDDASDTFVANFGATAFSMTPSAGYGPCA